MVIKREENINKSNKWIEYIKSKSLLKKNSKYHNIKVIEDINISDFNLAKSEYIKHYHIKLIEEVNISDFNLAKSENIKEYCGGDIIKASKIGNYEFKCIIKNNKFPTYEYNDSTWERIKIFPFEKK